jgi:hypothetical protein
VKRRSGDRRDRRKRRRRAGSPESRASSRRAAPADGVAEDLGFTPDLDGADGTSAVDAIDGAVRPAHLDDIDRLLYRAADDAHERRERQSLDVELAADDSAPRSSHEDSLNRPISSVRAGYWARAGAIPDPPAYPLFRPFAFVGLALGVAAACLTMAPLMFAVVLTLFLCAGALWRRGEPAFVWSIGYQWVFVFPGYAYWTLNGVYPVIYSRFRLETAVWLSCLAFLVIALGIRAAIAAASRREWRSPESEQSASYSQRALLVVIVALSTVDWGMQVAPMGLFFNAAQPIYRLLEFRRVFFVLLLVTALRRNKGYGHCVIAGLVTLIPTLSSPMSAFQYVFVMILLAIASEWRPWSTSARVRLASGRRLRALVAAVLVVGVLGVVWNGVVKASWRERVLSGTVSQSALTAASEFMDTAGQMVQGLRWNLAIFKFVQRLSSSLGFFSLVLDRVPTLLPFEDGALTMRTVKHVTTPRIFFPDKPIIDSASWMVRLYAGQSAAGSETGTSVGLTYVAEFYIDYGPVGMFIGLGVLGFIIGLIYCGLRRAAPSYEFFRATTIALFPLHCAGYESELVKEFGGLLQAFLVFSTVLLVLGPWMHRALLETPSPKAARGRLPGPAFDERSLNGAVQR